MAISPYDRDGELNPDYLSEAEAQDWERSIPEEDIEWVEWWSQQTFADRWAARLKMQLLPFTVERDERALRNVA
jgi:hypothetical protein